MNHLPKEMFSHRFTYSEELQIIHLFTNYDLEKTKQLVQQLQQKDSSHFYFSNYIRNLIVFIQSLSIQCLSNGCLLQDVEKLRNTFTNLCLQTLTREDCHELFTLELRMVEEFYKMYTSSVRLSSPIVYKIVKAVCNDIHNANVKNISKEIGYSQSHCSAIFKQHYEQSLQSYIIDKKIGYVKVAILNNKGLQEIVDAIGFSSIAYMSRIFKQRTSISIKQFKQLTN